ncbi:hypothetical protein UFOVP181_27 [uncultured Caudovirales phage]|uniref:Uncharacterized protein n=1 Tax=uncultured Caudovirales phage TaxID=2100421 RepID=A0A6J7WD30_9CAUD|nr:hypothetical protein UFOVP57_136 [uncultured Caudovirales phage]CAB5208450.1 hypothetical protein UFOVP181_27 [uncultured Caudovirales phage]
MIKGLNGLYGVEVQAGNLSLPYISLNHNNPLQGVVRLNGTDLQYFDGTAWMTLPSSYASVGLDSHTRDLLQWVQEERTKQFRREALAIQNPQLKPALEAIKRAEDNFETLERIVTSEQQNI